MVFTPQNLDQHVTLEQRQTQENGLHTDVAEPCGYWPHGVMGPEGLAWIKLWKFHMTI